MTQTDSLSRNIALRMCEEAYSPNTTSCQSDFDVEQAEQIIASELAEREKKVEELVKAAKEHLLKDSAASGIRLSAALSGLGVK